MLSGAGLRGQFDGIKTYFMPTTTPREFLFPSTTQLGKVLRFVRNDRLSILGPTITRL
jgi:hypothetical protein